ncbi:putative cytochrome P450 313a4 [Iris pallida]|uniref:Cytochrome P450 313a4 n=1 Tax=Iris pallida TaxID=29817 RepID=A0AAX6IH01_IRIPA|nr:putative cytochrome P450 313a4 [Iris pallida]
MRILHSPKLPPSRRRRRQQRQLLPLLVVVVVVGVLLLVPGVRGEGHQLLPLVLPRLRHLFAPPEADRPLLPAGPREQDPWPTRPPLLLPRTRTPIQPPLRHQRSLRLDSDQILI